jgi:hypothetical protein
MQLSGTAERPRLAVFRSNQHMYAQVIDDTKGCTLASASTIQKGLREELDLSAGPTIVSKSFSFIKHYHGHLDLPVYLMFRTMNAQNKDLIFF